MNTTLPTAEQLERVQSREYGFGDPCVICGNTFNGPDCHHTVEETESFIKRVKRLTTEEKARILAKTANA